MRKLLLSTTVVLAGLAGNTAKAQEFAGPFGIFEVVAEPKSSILTPELKLMFQNGVATEEQRDETTLEWVKGERTTGTVDAHGNQTLLKIEEVDGSGNYETQLHMEQTCTYDGSNRVTSFTRKMIGDGTTIEVTGNITYDGAGRYNPITGNFIASGVPIPAIDSFVYDANGKMSERILLYNMGVMTIPQSRKVFNYTGNDLSTVVTYNYDGEDWVEDKRVTLTHNGSGNITTRLTESFDEFNTSWILEESDSFEYSGSNVSRHIQHYHNGTSWVKENDNQYFYSGSKLDYFIVEDGGMKIFAHYTGNKIDSLVGHTSDGSGGWSSISTARVLFSEYTSVNEVSKTVKSVSVYPNPANDVINFAKDMRGAQVAVYSITGQTMIAQTLEANQLDVSSLKTGIYFVQLSLNGETYRTKISVK